MALEILHIDPYLKPYESILRRRYDISQKFLRHFEESEGLDMFTRSYERMGLNVQPNGDIIYREWAPNAIFASLVGDFNSWDTQLHPMSKNSYGVFEIIVPAVDGKAAILHGSRVKIFMITTKGERIYRIPAWIRRATQDLSVSSIYDGIFWNPSPYIFRNSRPPPPNALRIYEVHSRFQVVTMM